MSANRTCAASVAACLAVLAIVLGTPGIVAQQDCSTAGVNAQCNAMGSIRMDTEREANGAPVAITATVVVDNPYIDAGTRWIMFAVRNVSSDASPIQITFGGLSSDAGQIPIVTAKQDRAAEIDLWVMVLDVPLHTPITLNVTAGSTASGLFRIETLVEAFDRNYAPIPGDGNAPATLFSFTRLAVTKATSGDGTTAQSTATGNARALPAIGVASSAALIALVALAVRSRRDK
ncbi:MAG: hypothetical protein ACYDCK_03810 [Thermoplasmatota archaeon]